MIGTARESDAEPYVRFVRPWVAAARLSGLAGRGLRVDMDTSGFHPHVTGVVVAVVVVVVAIPVVASKV